MSAKGFDHFLVEIRIWLFELGRWDSKPWTEKSPLTLPETKMTPNKATATSNIHVLKRLLFHVSDQNKCFTSVQPLIEVSP